MRDLVVVVSMMLNDLVEAILQGEPRVWQLLPGVIFECFFNCSSQSTLVAATANLVLQTLNSTKEGQIIDVAVR